MEAPTRLAIWFVAGWEGDEESQSPTHGVVGLGMNNLGFQLMLD